MAEDAQNLVLEHLKHIRARVDVLYLDMIDVKARMTGVEEGIGTLSAQYANQSRRIDRIEERLSRIERRLDLVQEPQA